MTHIAIERRGAVGVLCIDRPDKRNAFTFEMMRELALGLTELEQDETVVAMVVHAAGNDFTTGLDLMDVLPRFNEGSAPFTARDSDPWDVLGRPRQKPLVAAVQGRCFTLGFELALAADSCIAARDAVFALREVRFSMLPLGGGVVRMLETCGYGTTMRYALTGDDLPAAEAYRLNLVQALVEPGEQLSHAFTLAERIAAQPPLAVRAALVHAREALEHGRRAALDHTPIRVRALLQSDDAREAATAHLERRSPTFRAR